MIDMNKVRNAFRSGVELNEEEVAALIVAMKKDASLRQNNMRRTMNYGGIDESELERQRKYARRRADRKKLPQAWGSPIPPGAVSWD